MTTPATAPSIESLSPLLPPRSQPLDELLDELLLELPPDLQRLGRRWPVYPGGGLSP